jgi:hypothetical protein
VVGAMEMGRDGYLPVPIVSVWSLAEVKVEWSWCGVDRPFTPLQCGRAGAGNVEREGGGRLALRLLMGLVGG